MTFPATDTPLPWVHAAVSAASDRPIWMSATHTIKWVPWNDGAYTGTYVRETSGKYNTAPFLASAGEPTTSGGYTQGGITMSGVTCTTPASSGKEVVSADFLVVTGVSLSMSIRGCTIHDASSTSAWILTMINWGTDINLIAANSLTMAWPVTPVGVAGVSGTIFDFR